MNVDFLLCLFLFSFGMIGLGLLEIFKWMEFKLIEMGHCNEPWDFSDHKNGAVAYCRKCDEIKCFLYYGDYLKQEGRDE